MSKTHILLLASVLTWVGVGAMAASPPEIAPEGPIWSAGSGFNFESKADKKRESLSGIACPPMSTSERRCIAAFDEGGEARYVVIAGNRLVPEPEKILLLSGDKELDAEGAARDGDTVYITGSHAPKRSDCQSNPDSRHVFRFRVGAANGRATLDGTGKPVDLADDQSRLWKLLTANQDLQKFAGDGKCLGKPDHAVNIEGLGANRGMLFFGFREPAKDRHTYILPVRADELFVGGVPSAKPLTVEVGRGRGIRDLLAVPEGVLLLLGPDDSSGDTGWSVALWDGSGSVDDVIVPKILANLKLGGVSLQPCKPSKPSKQTEIKPEAFTMLEDGPDFRRLLILSDGMCDGGAMSFRIPK